MRDILCRRYIIGVNWIQVLDKMELMWPNKYLTLINIISLPVHIIYLLYIYYVSIISDVAFLC